MIAIAESATANFMKQNQYEEWLNDFSLILAKSKYLSLISEKMKKIKDEIIRFEFSSDFQKEEETEKKEKIGAICERIVLLGEFKFIKEISNFETEASNKFSTQIKNWIHQLRKAVETRTFDEQSCYLLNLQYSNLQLIFNFYSGDKDLYSEFCKIPEILREQVKTIYDQTFKTKDFQEKVWSYFSRCKI